ncbi:cytochrome c [Microbulbifer sp. OS29]|uniref:Cytochrome c n=1 Tax=Microbulbifer okhotskensis TaxID=2926617 RepID=A0A9X2J3H0_9GAMM|nr:cytochrome c [Microbulbifer okhotskensis]MCO1333028.1 cytochrome c [Microbulbifer okhotskensis]
MRCKWIWFLLLSIYTVLPFKGFSAQEQPSSDTVAAQASNLLSYIAVNYGDAVSGGQLLNTPLYAFQRRHIDEILILVGRLPDRPGRANLEESLGVLREAIENKKSGAEVRRRANAIADRLAALYQLQRSPTYSLPSADFMMPVYQQRCASCHGNNGEGSSKGPDFSDAKRMAGFSLYDLYNTLDPSVDSVHGSDIDGNLSGLQRWALAVTVASFAVNHQLSPSPDLARRYPGLLGLPGLATSQPAELPQELQEALMWWRGHPHLIRALEHPLVRAVGLLQLAETDYRAGDSSAAYNKLILAYREGYRPLRPQLQVRDKLLVNQLQAQWHQLRSDLISGASSTEIIAALQNLRASLNVAHTKLEPPLSQRRGYLWAALLFSLALGLGLLLWWGLRERKRSRL